MFRIAAAVIAFVFATPVFSQSQEGLHWLDNYQQALAEAKQTNKPIFLEFRCEA